MVDIKNPRVLWFKGILFLGLGLIASSLLLLETRNVKVALLLMIAVWAFCRAYYFAFYVIEHYADPRFHYAGLTALLRYVLRTGRGPEK